MNENDFNLQKGELKNLLTEQLSNVNLSAVEIQLIKKLDKLLKLYTYSNRLNVKGVLSRVIIDDAQIDYSIGSKFLEFDDRIS